MADKFSLKAIISAVDKLTPTLKGIQKSAKITQKSLLDIRNASGTLMASLGVTGAAVGAGLVASVKKIVDVSAEFERFQTILETVEGSSEKAKASMAWVEEFAKKTPYELTEVMDSFVKLKAYGIDPTGGSLKSIGDAAAAMGKPVIQGVEALADAMTGENERLKEFGIKASKSGDQIRYTWTENGKTMAAVARASSKEQIEAVITGIWNRRYGGAMDKLSGTWTGMWSNLMDTFTGFIRKIGSSGFFDAIKKQLEGILGTLNKMAEDGSLQKLAEQISANLVEGLKELVNWVASVDWKAFFTGIKDTIVQIKDFIKAIGGVKTLLIAFAALLLSGPIIAIGTIIGAIWRLRLAFYALGEDAGKSGKKVASSINSKTATGLSNNLASIAKNASLLATAFSVGLAIGDQINKALSEKTKEKIGETITKALAAFGNEDAKQTLKSQGISQKRSITDTVMSFGKLLPVIGGAFQVADSTRSGTPLAGPRSDPLKGEIVVKFENTPPGTNISQGKTNHSGLALNPDAGYRPMSYGL